MFGLGEPKCHECKQLERELDREIAKNRSLQLENEELKQEIEKYKKYERDKWQGFWKNLNEDKESNE